MSCAKVISPVEVLPAGELGRRRCWTHAEKLRIVEKSYRSHRQGSAVARKYGIARGLGLMPRAALRALVDYGLNDNNIAQYHEMPVTLVSDLRAAWGIAPASGKITDRA